ncbi:A disintegrin and metalloproteinase with thrombospondin motifs 20 [Spea bombifrons]|uniref:A disintegrin and metalloproteinase with thrombospondin motifs 20 n=1 Tax=Spea bombifrons TaxID=233779 RepID=UPI0023499C04|nr:A disintegrin and metalloproteinase with thrombospondin motifs 20 [Spea bombifrons]
MLVTNWLAGLVCHLCFVHTRSWESRLHPKKDSFVKDLSSYEVVIPSRVNDLGGVFHHTEHFQRRKRGLDFQHSDSFAHRTLYRFSAYGQLFQFNLTVNANFIADSYNVVHIGNQSNFDHDISDLRHCFYSGHVNGLDVHAAVFSLCGGMIGTFKAHDGEYFLEPLMQSDGLEYEDGDSKPHLLYRHEVKHNDSSGDPQPNCAASEPKKKEDLLPFHVSSSFAQDINSLVNSAFSYSPQNKTQEDENKIHIRKKRFLSYPRYVELMVAADAKMVRHHGRNLQHYILTLMSIVAAIYKDPSIGNLINIMIVKLVVIHSEQDGPVISFNAATTLHNFCVWQKSQNIPDDSHPSHYDTAVLLTREDICRATDKCDTLGLAELGTMCDPHRSCSISEENGLGSAFTIAHELGHVFNMPHDDSFKCREAGIKNQFHVMSATLNYDTSPWTWSACSKKYITEFLDTGYGECLLDKPSGRIYEFSQQLPGAIYDANKQCELMFGIGSQVCPYMKQCRRLWCISREGIRNGCRTQHMPLADGSDCGPGMHCRSGLCVNKFMDSKPVDGEWGSWGPYSSCSRTCGGGIKSSTRECNRPEPRNGGKYCVGRRMKFRSCNTESCPKGKKEFRDEQCSQFDGKHFNINGLTSNVRWIPKYSGILMKDRCKLFCRVSGSSSYYPLKDRVTDGTPCGPETDDVCVQGLCREAGCDHILNSKARKDKCGVCGGDNSSCKTMMGTFNHAQYGYTTIVKIPVGSTNIDIHQRSSSEVPDDNYLALSDSQGNFFLNGNFVVTMFKREIIIRGATFEYSGSDSIIERINSTDRLEEELILQVLCVGNLYSPDVQYSFNIPIEDKNEQFAWDPYGPWQSCNKMCQGMRKRKHLCLRRSDRFVVSDQRCEHLPRPESVTEPCNGECQLRWYVAGKSECSSQCGQGLRTLDIRCMKYSSAKGTSTPVGDKFCASFPKPTNRERCNGDCLSASWHYTEWSQCSKSCGRGVQVREAYCMNNFGRRLADRECSEHRKVVTQSCSEHTCPVWTTSEWSECHVTCGKGFKHRHVSCQVNDEQLKDNYCDPNSKPESVRHCELQECASWQVEAWGPCSVTCGHGYQLRKVKCVFGSHGATLDERECNAATRPTDSQDCERSSCQVHFHATTLPPGNQMQKNTQWRYGSWTQCSASCGSGNRARYVSCRDMFGGVADESSCAHSPRPAEVSSCFTPCGEWQSGDWSPCPVTCGRGKVMRQVVCVGYEGRIEDINCDPENQPIKEQECNMGPCKTYNQNPGNHDARAQQPDNKPTFRGYDTPDNINQRNKPITHGIQWRTGPWGACSSTCSGGFEHRVVVCQDEEGRSSNFCDQEAKPAETRRCDSGTCPRWNHGIWGECTKTCGGGMKTRLVICQLTSGQILNDQNCEILSKPPNVAQCNTHACPADTAWHLGPWKSCSVTCGKGVKYRTVSCVTKGQQVVVDEKCKHLRKPRTEKICRNGRCPSWKAGTWNECSVTCGVGTQHRDVYCRKKGHGRMKDTFCNHSIRPDSQKYCQLPECFYYHWVADEWPGCSTECKDGESRRKVKCVDKSGRSVNDAYCDPATKPPATKTCKNVPCKHIVVTEDMSQCTGVCWFGYKKKITYCKKVPSTYSKYKAGIRSVVYKRCPIRPWLLDHTCKGKSCVQAVSWKVGKWSKCSVTCGVGMMERRVVCMTDGSSPSDLCPSHVKPPSRKTCQSNSCDFKSCKEIRLTNNIQADGEYTLSINNRKVKVYCLGMQSDSPKEYITLVKGEADNFSEVFGYRLKNPYQCPFNGSRNHQCACKNDYLAAGYTAFSKVRLDLISMQIKTTDLHFAHTLLGRAVPFATAGDCYSAAKCPQGQFSINLSGTDFQISNTARWISQGNYATVNIHKSQDGSKIYGRCGGYCGKCVPHSSIGLPVQVL